MKWVFVVVMTTWTRVSATIAAANQSSIFVLPKPDLRHNPEDARADLIENFGASHVCGNRQVGGVFGGPLRRRWRSGEGEPGEKAATKVLRLSGRLAQLRAQRPRRLWAMPGVPFRRGVGRSIGDRSQYRPGQPSDE